MQDPQIDKKIDQLLSESRCCWDQTVLKVTAIEVSNLNSLTYSTPANG